MRKQLFFLFILLCSFSFNKSSSSIVKKFIKASNNYNFKKVTSTVAQDYKETFIDGSVEIKNLKALKKRFEWKEVMNSKIILKKLKVDTKKGQVVTIETHRNYIDEILNRKPRTLKIIYKVNNNKIINAVIDTLPGHKKQSIASIKKWEAFVTFCEKNNLDTQNSSDNRVGAKKLKEYLLLYAKSKKR